MKNLKKELVIAVAVTFIIAGLVGFYVGRYYEGQVVRKRFQQRMGTQGRRLNGNVNQTSGSFVPGGNRTRPYQPGN